MTSTSPTRPGGAVATRLLAIVTVLLAIVLLRMTRTVTMPLVAGILVAALMWPVLQRLRRLMPRPLALLATVLLVIAVVAALFGTIAWSAGGMGERMLERRDRLETLRRQVEGVTSRVGIGTSRPAAGGTADTTAAGGSESGAGGGLGERAGRMLVGALAGLSFMVAFMALALAEADETDDRIRRRFPRATAERFMAISQEVAAAVHRYFVVKSLTSVITGVSTLLITLAFGLDFWYIWGLLAFLLEYVPTIGSILAVVPPALWAAIQFDGLSRPLAIAGTLTVAQLFLGNYVDPKIEGRYLALSPFMVLLSIVFWAWLWGAAGSLMGVPLTLAITTIARHFEGSRWIWALMTEEKDES